jgi:hypothetical protein
LEFWGLGLSCLKSIGICEHIGFTDSCKSRKQKNDLTNPPFYDPKVSEIVASVEKRKANGLGRNANGRSPGRCAKDAGGRDVRCQAVGSN